MKHFWLNNDQQAIMDDATSTASKYGFVALLDVPLAWKMVVKGLVGSAVADANHFRIHKITNDVYFGNRIEIFSLKSAIRLTASQAMMLKLKITDRKDGMLISDPTGENWGNIAISAVDRTLFQWGKLWQAENCRRYSNRSAWLGFQNLVQGYDFGPTLVSVGNSCRGMPTNWARAMVWNYKDRTHRFSEIADVGEHERLEDAENLAPLSRVVICRELFNGSSNTKGEVAARLWTLDCQRESSRRKYGIADELGDIL